MISSNTIVILNAPPAAGKNTVADALCEATGAPHSEFKDHLYQCTAVLFNVPVETVRALATDRDTKEVPNKLFEVKLEQYNHLLTEIGEQCNWDLPNTVSLSPRQALIYTSECVFKPVMGKDYFGKIADDNIDIDRGTVFSDGGFPEEVTPIIQKYGTKNVFIVQFTGQGVTGFEGDSRNWLTIPEGVATLKTTNNGTIEEIRDEILDWIKYEREVQQETFK